MGNEKYNPLVKEMKSIVEKHGNLLNYEICKGRSSPYFGEKYVWLENEMEKNNLNAFSNFHLFSYCPKKSSLDNVITSLDNIWHNRQLLLKKRFGKSLDFYFEYPRWEFENILSSLDKSYEGLDFNFGGLQYMIKIEELKLSVLKNLNSTAFFDKKSLEIISGDVGDKKNIFRLKNIVKERKDFKFNILENFVVLPYLNKTHYNSSDSHQSVTGATDI